jgi:hypothetical protein
MTQPNVRIKKNEGFILPVALILLFIALSAGVVATKLSMQQSKTTGSALDSFVSLNYAKGVLTLCESNVLINLNQLQADYITAFSTTNLPATLPASSALWQTWTPGSTGRTTSSSDPRFDTAFSSASLNLFNPTPAASIATEFQLIVPATANGACLIEPLQGDRFVLTARAMTHSTFDMVQLQSFIAFGP